MNLIRPIFFTWIVTTLGLVAEPGLVVLYDFTETEGNRVEDRSGVGEPIHLRIEDPKAVTRSAGSLRVTGKTLIRSEKRPTKLIEAIEQSGAITLAAWIEPGNLKQEGPARILTFSGSTSARNFTLGQERDRYDVRFRTTRTDRNGMPGLASRSKTVETRLTHVVYTRDRSGRARVYLNGKPNSDSQVPGEPKNWDDDFQLALANELTKDRPWQGTFHRVAIYNRDLNPGEIATQFEAGPDGKLSAAQLAERAKTEGDHLFETKIAPLFSQHCLECHDAAIQKGKLDLSRKSLAMTGGKSGSVIVPGKPEESKLWDQVFHDEMPEDREPLASEEKEALKKWIELGAPWPTETIDPAIYAHAGKAQQTWVQRLTIDEYIETVRATVGVDIGKEARELLPPDLRADGFSNTAYNLNIDLKHVDAYGRLAEIILDRMDVPKFVSRFTRSRSIEDKPVRALLEDMGKFVLRGPLDAYEINALRGISTTVSATGGDFDEAMRYVIMAMLQSPRFVYRIEKQRGDGGSWPVGNFELASRMSYILWGGPPDEALLKAADAGHLTDSSKFDEQLHRMLRDPRTIQRSRQFAAEWLDLGRLENLRPNPNKFPNWTPELADDMRAETLAFFEEVVWKQNRPMADLLSAQVTFATPRLAQHYGLPPKGDGLERYELASFPARGGLLTQGSVLTIGGDEASMVARGLFVLHDLLRGSV